jgi:hypothetical protein
LTPTIPLETEDVRRKAKALVDAVAFDDVGSLIAGVYTGGNGGLLSRETIKAADELRKALLKTEVRE